jgi:hypothetical protein
VANEIGSVFCNDCKKSYIEFEFQEEAYEHILP